VATIGMCGFQVEEQSNFAKLVARIVPWAARRSLIVPDAGQTHSA
jgi:hypothetical protein